MGWYEISLLCRAFALLSRAPTVSVDSCLFRYLGFVVHRRCIAVIVHLLFSLPFLFFRAAGAFVFIIAFILSLALIWTIFFVLANIATFASFPIDLD